MGRHVLSTAAYTRVAKEAERAGSATFAGEERRQKGLGLHPLVDPSGGNLYDPIRRSISWLEPEADHFVLLRGVAILEETRLDTTGSMGTNVKVAMDVLPSTYELLATGPAAVLGRYDVQMITSIFGDVRDDYILCRSQAEMDERIAEQMTLMVPEGEGYDADEDPQYGLFGGAYLTTVSINDYGLNYYDFTVSDARGRHRLDAGNLVRVFGESVFEKVAENGHGYQINARNIPTTEEIVASLLERAHAFFLQVGNDQNVTSFWRRIYGDQRVIVIPEVRLLPYVKAAIIGLTEGVFDLQSVETFLTSSNLAQDSARLIARAVAGIPIGAQMALPNFHEIPLRGARFAKTGDIWPIGHASAPVEAVTDDDDVEPEDESTEMWL